MKNILLFHSEIGHKKPETILNQDASCDFCCPEKLVGIIAREKIAEGDDGEIILVKNKFNVVENADQFVLIECGKKFCREDFPKYSFAHQTQLLQFVLSWWRRLSQNYQATFLFKNYGFLAGGTMRHPHMQIIGLHKNIQSFDVTKTIEPASFHGTIIFKNDFLEVNFPDRPNVGFGECNIIVKNFSKESIAALAPILSLSIQFLTQSFSKTQGCYNLFFYAWEGGFVVKVIPRYPTSPYLIGYDIRFTSTSTNRLAQKFSEYLAKNL